MKEYPIILTSWDAPGLFAAMEAAMIRAMESGDLSLQETVSDFCNGPFKELFDDLHDPNFNAEAEPKKRKPKPQKLTIIDGIMQCPACGYQRPADSAELVCPICPEK